jgi:hypothetical protein
MNTHALALLAAKVTLGASLALGLLLTPHATAHADDVDVVNLSELPGIDSMPVCHVEDGSDVDPALLPCVWTNQGNAWLTYADRSFLIVDDTTHQGTGGLPGPN